MSLDVLPDALAWIVHPAAAFALIHWAGILYSRRGRVPGDVLRAAGIIVLIGVLGAAWVAHPAAGMLLGSSGSGPSGAGAGTSPRSSRASRPPRRSWRSARRGSCSP